MLRKTASFLGALLIGATTLLVTATPAEAQMRGGFSRGGHASFSGPGMSNFQNLNHGSFRRPRVVFYGGFSPYYWNSYYGNPYYAYPYYGYPYYGNPYYSYYGYPNYVGDTNPSYYIP